MRIYYSARVCLIHPLSFEYFHCSLSLIETYFLYYYIILILEIIEMQIEIKYNTHCSTAEANKWIKGAQSFWAIELQYYQYVIYS